MGLGLLALPQVLEDTRSKPALRLVVRIAHSHLLRFPMHIFERVPFLQVYCILVKTVNLLETFRRNMPISALRTYVRIIGAAKGVDWHENCMKICFPGLDKTGFKRITCSKLCFSFGYLRARHGLLVTCALY